MFYRTVKPSTQSSFFIFGARGTGKSTFIEHQLLPSWGVTVPPELLLKGKWSFENVMYFDLLDDEVEEALAKDPEMLKRELAALKEKPKWVIIDEVQKIPRLLDVVHSLIEKQKIKFILSGSSARKLKKEGANLLGGRAFEYSLMPLTSIELGDSFHLDDVLNFGSLPAVFSFSANEDKGKFLRSYVRSYVKMEIQIEQLLRKLDPFREFLDVSAQMNGKILNFTRIARDVGVDVKTVQLYYLILEETYLGFRLPSFHHSIRKSQILSPKFYYFDVGVKRALEQSLHAGLAPGTSYYGEVFEHFIILEFYRLNLYHDADFRLSFFATKEGAEVDLVLSRGKEVIFVEIKSSEQIDPTEVRKLKAIGKNVATQCYYLSKCKVPQEVEGVRCLPWQKGLKEIFS
ncbi:MAG: ATP-binding protein [Proteobacteria bacterium]|nr:ATP-binding protein [Pseudomonadota bacterium]